MDQCYRQRKDNFKQNHSSLSEIIAHILKESWYQGHVFMFPAFDNGKIKGLFSVKHISRVEGSGQMIMFLLQPGGFLCQVN